MKKILKIAGLIIKIIAVLTAVVAVINAVKAKSDEVVGHVQGFYEKYVKRPLDFFCASFAAAVLSPVFIVLSVIGSVAMKGNPFFVYPRAGKDERIFNVIKFRSMAELKDENGEYLPDEIRLNRYGKLLRSTSLDELPEFLNIIKGDMSIVGPRPLTYKYLDYYTQEENRRHEVRPGLTGLAQVNGRNAISWEERFKYDVKYVNNVTLINDIKIIKDTVSKVIKRSDIGEGNASIQSLHEIRSIREDLFD